MSQQSRQVEALWRQEEYSGERDMERFWEEAVPQGEPLQRRWYLPLLVALLVASVPWYLPAGFRGQLLGGLPIWAWTTLGCSLGVSALTAYGALCLWHDED